uniref:Tetratricopeptide repeat protein n=1 Tax=uncultured Parabacteroides sp. TaxID=512312 RepID=A0A3G2C7E7_9BACT|nr:hypothetical protein [uncultured Parabacteroides sp.]
MKMTINLRKVLFFLLTLCLIGSAYAQDTALKEAEVAYTKEDYAKAIELYEGILKSNGESAPFIIIWEMPIIRRVRSLRLY